MSAFDDLVNAMLVLTHAGEHLPGEHDQDTHGHGDGNADKPQKDKWKSAKSAAQDRVDKAPPIKKMSDVIEPKEGQAYRIVTGDDYDDALSSGELRPGKAADTGGTINFSKEPIPVYAGSAFASHGLIVEVAEDKFRNPDRYPGSKDLYIGSKHSVPLSDVSRAWAVQYNPLRIVDITDIVKGLSS